MCFSCALRASVLFASVVWASPASAHDRGCALPTAETASAVRALDGETLILSDGRELRLIGAMAPPPPRAREADRKSFREEARDALDALAAGNPVEIRYGGARGDRHGRILAHAFVLRGEERIWLQGALIERGLARAYSFADNHSCMAELLRREALAREGRIGLWRARGFQVRQASEAAELLRVRQSFQIVEGVVREVGKAGGRLYLNFGDDWRTDFTVSMRPGVARGMKKAGLDPATLKGARIRVRGWIEPRNGPSIEATHAAEIERLAPAPETEPAAEGPPVAQDISYRREAVTPPFRAGRRLPPLPPWRAPTWRAPR
jgi:micrococcal nuclease